MSNTISTALNMAPMPVVAANATPRILPEPDPTTDFEFARSNMYETIIKGQETLTELVNIAKQSQTGAIFESVSTLINSLVTANKELLEIHKKHRDLTQENTGGKQTINNNLTISSSELLSMLKADKNNGQ